MKKLVITGGAGFIGTHLAERLAGSVDVVLFDNFRRDSLVHTPTLRDNARVTIVRGDVLEPRTLQAAFEGADAVIHLAAIAGVSSYYSEPLRTLHVNILGTINALEAARDAKVKTFIHFSTSEVFGPDALFVDEESGYRVGPVSDKRWTYATSKLAGEQLTLRAGEAHGFNAIVIRPFNVYGPRQTGEGAIGNFCRAAIAGEPLKVYGEGSAIRAWCYVSDMVDAVDAALRIPAAAGLSFNIGNPTEADTTMGLARRFQRFVPNLKIVREDVTRAEVRARVPNISRARTVLGFEPKIDLDQGLALTLASYRKA